MLKMLKRQCTEPFNGFASVPNSNEDPPSATIDSVGLANASCFESFTRSSADFVSVSSSSKEFSDCSSDWLGVSPLLVSVVEARSRNI